MPECELRSGLKQLTRENEVLEGLAPQGIVADEEDAAGFERALACRCPETDGRKCDDKRI
jgi:hypothetical protein